MTTPGTKTLAGLTLLALTKLAQAEKPATASVDDLAKAVQNPIANLISVPFQNNTSFEFGPEKKTQNVLNIQPVVPFELSDRWNLITRTIVPVVSQPRLNPVQERENGLSNTLFSGFLSPANPGGVIWGAGPAIQLPTATDDQIAADEWAAGPSVVVLAMPGQWVMGMLASNIWDIDADEQINFFTLQYFLNYNFSGGWYLTSSPVITANWEAEDEWTLPFGGGFGRVFHSGKQAVNMQVQVFYNVEKPDNIGPDWSTRFQLQLMFPK